MITQSCPVHILVGATNIVERHKFNSLTLELDRYSGFIF